MNGKSTNPFDSLTITSRVSDIFDPIPNDLLAFVEEVSYVMNSNTVLLKGQTNMIINPDTRRPIFTGILSDAFVEMFLEFDRRIDRHDYHEWTDIGSGPFPRPWPETAHLVKSSVYQKMKPMSILSFVERLHWMLRTSFSPHHTHCDEQTALELIRKFLTTLFGTENWNIDKPLTSRMEIPKWVDHPWTFYDVTPDFLHSTGYWNHEEEPPENVSTYFDSGESDSCTFFYRETNFYLLLTNGCP